MTRNRWFKVILFAAIFLVLFCGVSKIMTAPGDYRNYQFLTSVYEESPNSLDAVYIGSSNCYAFWNSMVAWNEYGIAVPPYSSNNQPIIAAEYLIREVRKTQPNAVFILNTNSLGENKTADVRFHYLLDYMPFSYEKLALTHYLTGTEDMSFSESLEFYIPLIRYHGRWSELSPEDFNYTLDGFKGASDYNAYWKTYTDITDLYITTNETQALPPVIDEAFDSLLDYCTKEDVKILFVTVPRAEKDETIVKQINTLNAKIRDRGFTVLDLMDEYETVGADLTQDYYNDGHMNVHGSVKYTQYLSEYLIENYGFKDKRTDKRYESWNTGFKKYNNTLNNHILAFELNLDHRDFSLPAPEEFTATVTEDGIKLNWSEVEGANRYMIFRKSGNGDWKKLKTTNMLELLDDRAKEGIKYSYRVVPYYKVEEEVFYGTFDYNGVSATVK